MIRRTVGNEFLLITQHDHALLAGELARHVGNKLFDQPRELRESFLLAVAQHDCGWPLHDDHPTLNRDHLPIDVFESTREIALRVWQASVDRTLAMKDDYAALLVTLHVLSLSTMVSSATNQSLSQFDPTDRRTRFEVNRFQHKQIEIQESLRKKLALPTDVPMRQGLAEDAAGSAEQLLQYHFRMLQAMDMLSLGLCCTEPPTTQIKPVMIRPGGKSVTLSLRRISATDVQVSPWPFDGQTLQPRVPFRKLPALRFEDQPAFEVAYRDAPGGEMSFVLQAG